MNSDKNVYYGGPDFWPNRNGILCTDAVELARLQQAAAPAIESDESGQQLPESLLDKVKHVGQAAIERVRTFHLA